MTNDENTNTAKPPSMIAWHVTEGRNRKFWTRIGAAWDHGDGEGLSLKLDLLPVNGGKIVLRAPKAEGADGEEAA